MTAQVKKAMAGINPTIPVNLRVDRDALGRFVSATQKAANIQAQVDTTKATAAVLILRQRMEALARTLTELRLGVDDKAAEATIAKFQLSLANLARTTADIKITADTKGIESADVALLGLEAAVGKFSTTMNGTDQGLTQFNGRIGRLGVGLLTAQVALFGGAAAVSGFHIALDTVIEALAVIVPAVVTAAAGLGAFALAGSDAAKQVLQMVQSIHTVSDAMNATIPPMTGKLEALHAQVRPQVWQLYGDAIDAVHTKTGLFNQLAVQTGSILDRLAARFTVLITSSGPGLTTFLNSGKRDLAEFGRIALSLGDAFGKLIQITTKTHIAEDLLNIVGAAAKLFDIITKLPIPLLALVVGLHGLYLWGGLASSALVGLVSGVARMAASAGGLKATETAMGGLAANSGGLTRLKAAVTDLGAGMSALPSRAAALGKSLLTLAANPWTWAVIAVVAVTALAIWLSRAKDATEKWITSSQKLVNSATIFTAINVTAGQLTETTKKLAAAQNTYANAALKTGTIANQAGQDIKDLTQFHQQLSDTLTTETGRIAGVAHQFGTTLPGAMALATFAGVKISDLTSKSNTVWATAVQEIAGVVAGYKAMGQGSSQLGNDISAINVGASDQAKAIANLNTAWDSFTKIVAGPVTTFNTFAQDLVRFSTDAGAAGARMEGFGGTTVSVSKKVTTASLQLQSDFQSSFTAANDLFDAMRSSQAPAAQQIKSIKDTVAALIPLAGTNKAAAAEISALAQEAGGPATTNLKTLQKWAGVTAKQGMQGLETDTNNAAVAFSNLSADAAKLSGTLQTDLVAEESKAIENAVGLQGAMDKYTKSLKDNGVTSATTRKDRTQLYGDLLQVFHNADQANSVINTLSGTFTGNAAAASKGHPARDTMQQDFLRAHDTATAADKIIGTYATTILNNGKNTDAAKKARQQLITDLVSAGVNSTKAKTLVDQYTSSILNNGKNSDTSRAARQRLITDILNASGDAKGGKTDMDRFTSAVQNHSKTSDAYRSARTKLIQDLEAAGLNAKTATGLVNGLSTAISRVPKNPNVTLIMTGKGSYTISAGPRAIPNGPAQLRPLAAGGRVPGYGGGDRFPAMLEPGEAVVDKIRTARYAHVLGSMGVPGFAAGGLVTNMVPGGNPNILPLSMYSNFSASMIKNLSGQMSAAINNAVAAGLKAQAAAAGGGAFLGAGSANYAADITTVLKSLGLPLSLVSNWLRQIQTESGGNLRAVNRSDCITLDYMILTTRGWLRYDHILPGDQTIGYNPATQRSEWTPITRVVRYEDAEVWRIGNRHWRADVTPNHRWWSDTLTRVQPAHTTCPECGWEPRGKKIPARGVQVHRNKIHGIAPAQGALNNLRGEFVRTNELRSHHRVRLAAPADTAGIPGLSLDDVRVIAWLQGDGTLQPVVAKPKICPECNWAPGDSRKNRNPAQPANAVAVHRAKAHAMNKRVTTGELDGYDGTIWQSKPEMLIKLRALLARIEHTESVRQRREDYLPAHAFRLRRAYVSDLLKRSQLMEIGPEAFVLALSPDQRAAWLDSMIDAEGHRQPVLAENARRGASGEFVRIAQVDGPLQEAIKLAVYLEGYRPTYSKLTRHSDKHQPAGMVGMARPHTAPSMFDPPKVLEHQPVWCVTTELGTWTTKGGDDLPFLTGNSNAAAGHPSVGLLAFANHPGHVRGVRRPVQERRARGQRGWWPGLRERNGADLRGHPLRERGVPRRGDVPDHRARAWLRQPRRQHDAPRLLDVVQRHRPERAAGPAGRCRQRRGRGHAAGPAERAAEAAHHRVQPARTAVRPGPERRRIQGR